MSQDATLAAALVRVMEAADTRLDEMQVLYRLVDASLEATGADRCAVLLVDDGRLVPAAVAARRVNQDLFRRFRAMPPVPITGSEGRSALVWGSDLVVIEDVHDSDIVPAAWITAFGTTSLALAPITAADGLAGVLAFDFTTRHHFEADELDVVKAIAQCARLAIANAALRRRVRQAEAVQRHLLAGSAALAAAGDLRALLTSITTAVATLLPGSSCSISYLFEGGHTVVADHGRAEGGHRNVFSLRAAGGHQGYLTLVRHQALSSDELALVEAFAHQAALALERAELIEDLRGRLRRAEVLHRMSDLLRDRPDLAKVLTLLNREVCAESRFECLDVAFRHRRHAEAVGARTLTAEEAVLLARMSAPGQPAGAEIDPNGLRAVAVRVNGRPAGLLLARPLDVLTPLSEDEVDLLEAVAAGIGDVAHRAYLDRGLDAARRRLRINGAREQIGADFGLRLGRTLRAAAGVLSDELERTPEPDESGRLRRLHQLVNDALVEAHVAAVSTASLNVRDVGLVDALRETARAFQVGSGVATVLRVEGDVEGIEGELAECVHDLVYEVLHLVVAPGRAELVTVVVQGGERVVVRVRDDGVGLGQRTSGVGPGLHFAVGSLRQKLAAREATFALDAAHPRGISLVVELPIEPSTAPFSRSVRT